MTVYVDAGHGGLDPGATGRTTAGRKVVEKSLTLAVVDRLVPALRRAGFRVVASRTTDSLVHRLQPGDAAGGVLTVRGERADNAARAHCANESHAAAFVSVHFNAGSSARNAGALSIYDAARSFWRKSRALTSDVQTNLLQSLNSRGWEIPNDGIMTDAHAGGPALSAADARYGHLITLGPRAVGYLEHPSTMSGVVVEPLFLTDPFEATIASSRAGQRAISRGIAAGIETYLRP